MLLSGGCVCCLRRLVTYWHLPVSGVRPGPGYITSHRSRSPSQHWEGETGAGTGHLVTNIQGTVRGLRRGWAGSSEDVHTMLASVDDDTEGDDGVGDDCLPSLTESMRPLGEAALMPGPGHARQSQAGPTPHLNTPQHSSPLNTNNRNILYVYYLDMYHLYLHTKIILVSPQYLRCFPLKRIVEEKTNVMICLNWFCSPTFFLCLKFAPPQHELFCVCPHDASHKVLSGNTGLPQHPSHIFQLLLFLHFVRNDRVMRLNVTGDFGWFVEKKRSK